MQLDHGKSRCLWHRERALGFARSPPALLSLWPIATEPVSLSQVPPRPHGRSEQCVCAHSGNSRFCEAPGGIRASRTPPGAISPSRRSAVLLIILQSGRGLSLTWRSVPAKRLSRHMLTRLAGSAIPRFSCQVQLATSERPCATDPKADEQDSIRPGLRCFLI
jgi:hypothetical protein